MKQPDPSPSPADGRADFSAKDRRLKRALGLLQDQEVAAVLGMSKASYSDRKRRGTFPDGGVIALAARVPDLDVGYVLTGRSRGRTEAGQISAAASESAASGLIEAARKELDVIGLTQDLNALLQYCSPADIRLLIQIAARLGGTKPNQNR